MRTHSGPIKDPTRTCGAPRHFSVIDFIARRSVPIQPVSSRAFILSSLWSSVERWCEDEPLARRIQPSRRIASSEAQNAPREADGTPLRHRKAQNAPREADGTPRRHRRDQTRSPSIVHAGPSPA